MNLASSRSHCIFTIFITAAKVRLPLQPDLPRSQDANAVALLDSERRWVSCVRVCRAALRRS
eukprot:3790689-Rhodomonas_salina.2